MIKKLVFGYALWAVAGAVWAGNLTLTENDYAMCDKLAAASKAVMSVRQNGVPLVDALGLATIIDPEYAQEFQTLLRAAYGRPVATTGAGKSQETTTFTRQAYTQCRETVATALRASGHQ